MSAIQAKAWIPGLLSKERDVSGSNPSTELPRTCTQDRDESVCHHDRGTGA